jgi:hypothetical protein
MEKVLKFPGIFLLTVLFSSLQPQCAPAQTNDRTPQVSAVAGTAAAVSGTATSGSAVAYPSRGNFSPNPERQNELDPGTPSDFELKMISGLTFPSGFTPRAAVAHFVNKLAGKSQMPYLQRARFQFLEEPKLHAAFPDEIFYLLRFPQWPIGFAVPAPLQSNNIFVFDRSGKQVLITNPAELEKFFVSNAGKSTDENSAKLTIETYLMLLEQLAQDGMYKFSVDESSIKTTQNVDGIKCNGISRVIPNGGNKGEIKAELTFDSKGILVYAQQIIDLKAGMRPICQSTKLLDPDPLVRRMAEQDILIMGSAAKPYLDEQRQKLSPALQQAIDKIWQQILIEGR